MSEKELTFKGFTDGQQEQIRGLVSYAQLLGLTPNDLIKIGSKLKRMDQKAEARTNINLINEIVLDCERYGKDMKSPRDIMDTLDDRFRLRNSDGLYNFVRAGRLGYNVTSVSTKQKRFWSCNTVYYFGEVPNYGRQMRASILLEIVLGKFSLNF
jgi:hypothetical protein